MTPASARPLSYPRWPCVKVADHRRVFALCERSSATETVWRQNRRGDDSVTEVVKGSVDAVVLIVVNDESGKPFAEGSGFIASPDGKIVTNHHVILGAHSAVMKLNNGAFFTVEGVLVDDSVRDIAVLKVSGKNLPVLLLADSDALSAGDHVVAIGSPLGLENSVSDGIISGFREDSKGRSWIQTTAPALMATAVGRC